MAKNKPKRIIVHTSASPYATVELIDAWHRERGFSLGYHYVITNGRASSSKEHPRRDLNGKIWAGRDEDVPGAHVRGHNSDTLGVCMVGRDGVYTSEQWCSLYALLCSLMLRYGIPPEGVVGHYELNHHKTCPEIHLPTLRERIANLLPAFERTLTCHE